MLAMPGDTGDLVAINPHDYKPILIVIIIL